MYAALLLLLSASLRVPIVYWPAPSQMDGFVVCSESTANAALLSLTLLFLVWPGSDLTQYSLLSKLLIWQACEVCHAWCDTRCDGCGCTFYCCREHQKMDWPNHQKHCRALAFYSGRDQKNSVHLANAEKSQC